LRLYVNPVFSLIITALLLLASCEDATDVGSGLLGSEDLNLVQSDEFEIVAKTVESPLLTTYTMTNYTVLTHLLGQLDDPVFGKSEASFYTEVRRLSSNGTPLYAGGIVDSLVLTLELSEAGIYGDTLGTHTLEVFRLSERIINDSTDSDIEYAYDPTPIGRLEGFKLSDADSVQIYDPEQNDTMTVSGAIRIRLSGRLAGQIIVDSLAATSDAAFVNLLNGLYIRSTTENSVFGINLSGSTRNNVLTMYYRDVENMPRSYSYLVTGPRPIRFKQDYTGSQLSSTLDVPVTPDGLLYIQGMQGVNTLLDLSDVKKIKDEFINYAELEVTVDATSLADTTLYPIADQLSILVNDSSGKLREIVDVLNGRGNAGQLTRFFGGNLKYNVDNDTYTYTMNVTTYIKEMLKDRVESSIYLSIFNKVEVPQRVVIYGPDHPTHPIKLRITYTKL
jgi:hypothetical protein